MEYKEELELLRQQIPIGIRHGLNLLIKTNGDVKLAHSLFEQELMGIVISKASVLQEVAKKYLVAANYDIAKTLVSIEEDRYTLPERILRKSKNHKEEGLRLLSRNLENGKALKRDYWLVLDQLENLSPVQYCLLVVMEWLDYEDYEGFDYAIYFYLDIVAVEMEATLLLPEAAECVRAARRRSDDLIELYNLKRPRKKPFHVSNVIAVDEEFVKAENVFRERKAVIIERLYELVAGNIGEFD